MRATKQTILKACLDLFMPRSCVHCGEGVGNSSLDFLCTSCAREIFVCQPPACHTCGYPFFGELSGSRSCPHCAELTPQFEEGKALFLAKGPARSLLHELKYQSGFYALRDIHKLIKDQTHFTKYLTNSRLIPVPLHPVKERERGFNQSKKIADLLCRASNSRTIVDPILKRTHYTQTQTRLNRKDRQRNVKNAFALRPNAVLIPDQQYILVDDVFTTGSTLNACAAVLRNAGVERLKVVTIGHG